MSTTTKIKVSLANCYHGSLVDVVGELVDMGKPSREHEYDGQPHEGFACVRLTASQVKRAMRVLCGINGCSCGNLGPHFRWEGQDGPATVIGKVA